MSVTDPAAGNPYRPPNDSVSEQSTGRFRWLLTGPGVFFFTAGLIAQVLSFLAAMHAVASYRRALPGLNLGVIGFGFHALSLLVVSLIFGLLATGVCTFRSNVARPQTMTRGAQVARGAAVALVLAAASFGLYQALGGAWGGHILLVGCAAWVVSILYERHRNDQGTFRVGRWLIRLVATAVGLWSLEDGVTVLFSAAQVMNQLYWQLPGFGLVPAPPDTSAGNAIVVVRVVLGVSSLAFGLLLLRQVFGGLTLAQRQTDD